MEDRIKVGEYIRTNKGNIGKIIEIRLGFNKDTQLYQDIYKLDNGLWTVLDYIVKHSKNLIDLIEVGNFVNGMQVLDVYKPRDLWEPIEIRVDSRYTNFILAEDIKTILTKEQMMANCYKVGGEDE
mgnify:FL=1